MKELLVTKKKHKKIESMNSPKQKATHKKKPSSNCTSLKGSGVRSSYE